MKRKTTKPPILQLRLRPSSNWTATWYRERKVMEVWLTPNTYGMRPARTEQEARQVISESGVPSQVLEIKDNFLS